MKKDRTFEEMVESQAAYEANEAAAAEVDEAVGEAVEAIRKAIGPGDPCRRAGDLKDYAEAYARFALRKIAGLLHDQDAERLRLILVITEHLYAEIKDQTVVKLDRTGVVRVLIGALGGPEVLSV
jgi:hypothetical protein